MNLYEQVIFKSRYARYRNDLSRRETWEETVDRYMDNVVLPVYKKIFKSDNDYNWTKHNEIREAILKREVMPSMRMLMTAGAALDRDHVSGYNCSYLPIDHPRAFDEVMYILLCGTGVGFSVERQEVSQLPSVSEEFHETDTIIKVSDSKIGWASSYRELISLLYAGKLPRWDTSSIRPAGSRLKTFGGRASGPEPLKELFRFTIKTFQKAKGRKLSSLEVHDIICKIADVVVVGGVRRSALISLSNLTDERMRNAKMGQWWVEDVQRALANNSVAYTEKPEIGIFMKEWHSLYDSKSGERGLFNRVAGVKQVAKSGRRSTEGRDGPISFGTNPCAEIILRPHGFCNLSEVVVRPDDSFASLKRKVRIASIIGTIQSTFTQFRYLRSQWKRNTEEERLLGVSLTGIMDHPVLSGQGRPKDDNTLADILSALKQVAIDANKELAEQLGIPQSVAITCVKPSGTVSQLVGSSSGIHPSYSQFYVRTIRADIRDPLCRVLQKAGIPNEPDVTKPDSTLVFSFPTRAPSGSVTRNLVSAIDQLELYLVYLNNWCEHTVSTTIYVREHEWLDVAAWVYRHWDSVIGISFLPYSDHIYRQAPYQEVEEGKFDELSLAMPTEIDWTSLQEEDDNTIGSQELACVSGFCEVS